MPRKVTKKLQRQLQPDRKYQSVLVQRLINKSMLNGKKLVAERAVYDARLSRLSLAALAVLTTKFRFQFKAIANSTLLLLG